MFEKLPVACLYSFSLAFESTAASIVRAHVQIAFDSYTLLEEIRRTTRTINDTLMSSRTFVTFRAQSRIIQRNLRLSPHQAQQKHLPYVISDVCALARIIVTNLTSLQTYSAYRASIFQFWVIPDVFVFVCKSFRTLTSFGSKHHPAHQCFGLTSSCMFVSFCASASVGLHFIDLPRFRDSPIIWFYISSDIWFFSPIATLV